MVLLLSNIPECCWDLPSNCFMRFCSAWPHSTPEWREHFLDVGVVPIWRSTGVYGQLPLATPNVCSQLSRLPAVSGGAFTEAVDEIERFLIPFDCPSMLSAAVKVAAGAHVEAALQRHIGLTVFGLAKLKIIVHSPLKRGLKDPVYGPRLLDPYEGYLRERVESCPGLSGKRLFREIRELGYYHERYPESLNNLTPADVFYGRGQNILDELNCLLNQDAIDPTWFDDVHTYRKFV